MTVRAVRTVEGKCTVSIPEFSVSDGDPKRATRHVRIMNSFYSKLQSGIISFAASRDGQGAVRVRGVEGVFESEQTGVSAFRVKYTVRGRFLSSGMSGQCSVFRLTRVIDAVWSDGSVVSLSIK